MTSSIGQSVDTVAELRAQLAGEVLGPGDPGYDVARKIWNGMIDKHPAAIARCIGVSDVMQAVHLARAHDLTIAIRGAGHSAAGLAMCDAAW
jgi:FAD/FMN-containing dehydrogenase